MSQYSFLSPFRLAGCPVSGGDEEIRTLDPLLAGQVLSQLSYTPRGFRTLKIEQRMTFALFTTLHFLPRVVRNTVLFPISILHRFPRVRLFPEALALRP